MVQPIFQRAIRTDIQITLIEKWLNKKGFTIVRGKSREIRDEVKMEKKLVFLSTRQNLVNQMYSLLHECGHIMIRLDLKRFNEEYPVLAALEEKEYKKFPLRFHMEEVKEEINAWDNGLKLAHKLGIPINKKEYYNVASRWVCSYMAMATIEKKWLLA